MRAQVPTILLTGAALFAFAIPAQAEECGHTVYLGGYTRYVYEDIGITGSDLPVAQGGYTLTCGSWSFDNWFSAGERDLHEGAREDDFTVTFSHTFDTLIGPVATQTMGAYFFFDFKGLGNLSDDAYEFKFDAARPIKVGNTTVSPFIRFSYVGFVNGTKGIPLVRPGIRVGGPLTAKWSYSVEAFSSINKRDGIDRSRLNGSLNYSFGHGWSSSIMGKFTEANKPEFGFSIAKSW